MELLVDSWMRKSWNTPSWVKPFGRKSYRSSGFCSFSSRQRCTTCVSPYFSTCTFFYSNRSSICLETRHSASNLYCSISIRLLIINLQLGILLRFAIHTNFLLTQINVEHGRDYLVPLISIVGWTALAKGLVDDPAKGKSVKSTIREINSSERSSFSGFLLTFDMC